MAITTEQIKALRDETDISVMQCKRALEEAKGDMEKARLLLRKKGAEIAAKKQDRTLGSGVVASYIHSNGKIGAMVEFLCETDFVAGNQDFKKLAYELAMHATATKPEFRTSDDIPAEAKEQAVMMFQKDVEGKPANLKEKILEGKIASYFREKVFMEQSFIKDPEMTVKQLVEGAVQKFGEKSEIGRFVVFSLSK